MNKIYKQIEKLLAENTLPLLVIVGATASGKTATSIDIAQKYNGEIISADSRQIYKYLPIGTAQPTTNERNKIKHHLVDFLEPDQIYTVAQWHHDAKYIIKDIHQRKKLPIIVGGTGLWTDILVNNPDIPPTDINIRKKIEKELKEKGTKEMYQQLIDIDPISAKNIDITNTRRIIRAIEIYKLTGKPRSKWATNRPTPWQILQIGINWDREKLYNRINLRTKQMWQNNIIEEVKKVLDMGYNRNCTGLQGIGYSDVLDYIDGTTTLVEAISHMAQSERNYAKKQIIWHRKNKNIKWINNI